MDTQKNVLVIEDEEVLNSAISDKLRTEGFDVAQAFDGEHAFYMINKKIPDIIIVDIVMSLKDGLHVIKELHQQMPHIKAPIIVLTNITSSEAISKKLSPHVVEYLVKAEHTLEDIIRAVKNAALKIEEHKLIA